MATTTSMQSDLSPLHLRCLTGHRVVVQTLEGTVGGEVLSCTRHSLWLVEDDDDHVVLLDEITSISEV